EEGAARAAPSLLSEVEVRGVRGAVVERELEEVAAGARRRLPVVDVLVRGGVVAELGSAGGIGLDGVGRVPGPGGAGDALVGERDDGAEAADVGAARVEELPLHRDGLAGLARVHLRL